MVPIESWYNKDSYNSIKSGIFTFEVLKKINGLHSNCQFFFFFCCFWSFFSTIFTKCLFLKFGKDIYLSLNRSNGKNRSLDSKKYFLMNFQLYMCTVWKKSKRIIKVPIKSICDTFFGCNFFSGLSKCPSMRKTRWRKFPRGGQLSTLWPTDYHTHVLYLLLSVYTFLYLLGIQFLFSCVQFPTSVLYTTHNLIFLYNKTYEVDIIL